MLLTLTIIVAATPKWGIGKGGSLPWPMLKQEMAYFARVTKRPPPPPFYRDSSAPRVVNAVIMGRKTWESIPPRMKPLKDRINVVISRTPESLHFQTRRDKEKFPVEGPFAATSVSGALSLLEFGCFNETPESGTPAPQLGRVFIIGGAEIYSVAVQLDICDRILLTRIEGDWDCDTFFPLKLEESGIGQDGSGWWKRTSEELGDWADEDLGDGKKEQNGISWQWEMWSRNVDYNNDG